MPKTKNILLSLVALIISLGIGHAFAVWIEPAALPPGDNVSPPINTGSGIQNKSADIGATGFRSNIDGSYGIWPLNASAANKLKGSLTLEGGLSAAGNITLSSNATVDGSDLSDYSPYWIDSAGINGYVWKSDGSGKGVWAVESAGTTYTFVCTTASDSLDCSNPGCGNSVNCPAGYTVTGGGGSCGCSGYGGYGIMASYISANGWFAQCLADSDGTCANRILNFGQLLTTTVYAVCCKIQ